MNIPQIIGKKAKGEKIVMLTAYDFPFAAILDRAGVDIILVGDSLGNVALGYRDTLPVSMDEMEIHTRAVARAAKNALVVADMPFGSFQQGDDKAVGNAVVLVKAGAQAVKIEGAKYLPAIKKIIRAGIPVMGHIGFTPQSVNHTGYKMQGKTGIQAAAIARDARLLQKAGCFAVVLELIPEALAGRITSKLKIPTIGIGAGTKTDGQVMVTNDLLGLFDHPPSFARKLADLREISLKAVKKFMAEVVRP